MNHHRPLILSPQPPESNAGKAFQGSFASPLQQPIDAPDIRQPRWRGLLCWNAGWGLLALAWLGPLPRLAIDSFAAHMLLHMLIVAIATPLLALGIAGRHYDPVSRFPSVFSPIIASVGELLIVWAWHAPRLHHWARFDTVGFTCEQLAFLLAGLWIWMSVFGGDRPVALERCAAGVVGLLLTSMHMTLLGALLALSPRVLFQHGQHSSQDALTDQHLGGAAMLVIGGVVFLLAALALMARLIRRPRPAAMLRLSD